MGVHLVLLIHGLYGSPANLEVLHEELLKAHSRAGNKDELVVHIAKSFTGGHTWDGIDVNAWKASREIDAEIERIEDEGNKVETFSVIGYSLGGLVARYLVGLLHSRDPSFFTTHKPGVFSTAATPHLGILKYGSTTNTVIHTVGRRLFSRSGQQMYCMDRDEEGRPLLEVMADPDRVFIQALQLFPHIMIVANGCHDQTVPYPTASFSHFDPFDAYETTGVQVDVDEDNIVRSWHLPDGAQPVVPTARVTRPFFPPILLLPYPFTYLLVIFLPFILPLWFITLASVATIHSFQSRRRHQTHLADLTEPSSTTPLLSASPSNPLLSSLRSSASSPAPSGTSTPPLVDVPPDVAPKTGQVPLLLTPSQKIMARNLQVSLPQVERIVAWFPWAFNSHAVIIARHIKRFKTHEEGRKVVKKWSEWVISSTSS